MSHFKIIYKMFVQILANLGIQESCFLVEMWKVVYVTPGRSTRNLHTFLRVTSPSNKGFHTILNLHLRALGGGWVIYIPEMEGGPTAPLSCHIQHSSLWG